MTVSSRWDTEVGEWCWRVDCDYCCEPVYSTGPLERGDPEAALVLTDWAVVPFCSPECRDAWLFVYQGDVLGFADDVGPAGLAEYLPSGWNGYIEWPEAND